MASNNPSLRPEIGPDGLAREAAVIGYTERVLFSLSLFLPRFYHYLVDSLFFFLFCCRSSKRNNFNCISNFSSFYFFCYIITFFQFTSFSSNLQIKFHHIPISCSYQELFFFRCYDSLCNSNQSF